MTIKYRYSNGSAHSVTLIEGAVDNDDNDDDDGEEKEEEEDTDRDIEDEDDRHHDGEE